MLELRPNCESCDVDLPPGAEAYVCSFECTFCPPCANDRFHRDCPNCGGELVRRPTRTGEALRRNPASTKRVFDPRHGGGAEA